jgi:PAS domain S-box-containing protein
MLLVLGSVAVSYVLSRTPHYRFGCIVISAGLLAFVFGSLSVETNPQAILALPPYLLLIVIFACLVLNIYWTFAAALAALAALFLLPTVTPLATQAIIVDHARFITICSLLLITYSYLRQRDRETLRIRTRALEESQRRYRSLLEASFEPLVIHDQGVIIDMNPAAEELIGYRLDDLRGEHVAMFVKPEDRNKMQTVAPEAGPRRYELDLMHKDGSLFPAEVRTKSHIYQDRIVRVASLRNIATARQAEQQRLELALERVQLEILQKLIRNLSHDLRTPLAVIKTSLYLLERSLADPTRHHKHIEVVRGQTHRLQEIMDDVILLSRLDNARPRDFEFEVVDLDAILRDLINSFEIQTAKKQLAISYTCANEAKAIEADPTALGKALKCLVNNAISYTQARGNIGIEARLQGEAVEITVQDNGIGIAPEDVTHIFDHFYRADPARSSENGGAGLGLTIARKLIALHDGTIEVKSEPGRGSVFTITLPMRQQNHELPEQIVN